MHPFHRRRHRVMRSNFSDHYHRSLGPAASSRSREELRSSARFSWRQHRAHASSLYPFPSVHTINQSINQSIKEDDEKVTLNDATDGRRRREEDDRTRTHATLVPPLSPSFLELVCAVARTYRLSSIRRGIQRLFLAHRPLCPPPTRLYISPLTSSRHAMRQSALLSLSLSPLLPLLFFPPLPTAAPLSISPFTVLHTHTLSLSLPYSLFLLLSRVYMYIHTRTLSRGLSLPFPPSVSLPLSISFRRCVP